MDSNFQIIETKDGSPSLTWTNSEDMSESMHNKKGALSESLFIYHNAMEFITSKKWAPRFLSVGLGLGYNELILSAHLLKNKTPLDQIALRTFESSTFLKSHFLDWLLGKAPSKDELEWRKMYYHITEEVSKKFGVPSTDIKSSLEALYRSGGWSIEGALTPTTQFTESFSAILYDAFSSNVNPELWSEDFLAKLIFDATSPNSVFVTYAAKGSLNRALRNAGFILEEQPGFAGKRQSTFALRIANSLTPTNH